MDLIKRQVREQFLSVPFAMQAGIRLIMSKAGVSAKRGQIHFKTEKVRESNKNQNDCLNINAF